MVLASLGFFGFAGGGLSMKVVNLALLLFILGALALGGNTGGLAGDPTSLASVDRSADRGSPLNFTPIPQRKRVAPRHEWRRDWRSCWRHQSSVLFTRSRNPSDLGGSTIAW